MEKTSTALNRHRGALKSKITNISKFVSDFKEDPKTDKNKLVLQKKLDIVLETQKNVASLLLDYYNLSEDVDITESESALQQLELEAEELEVSLKLLLSKAGINSATVPNSKACNYKLPEIPLPQFFGKYEEFQNFLEQFMTIIGDNSELSEAQKLHYLKASLRGEAKSIETCEDTFKSLLSALKDRYDNKRAVVDTLVNNILYYDRSNESPSQMRQLVDNVKRNLRSLENLEYVRNELSDVLILNVIKTKLDRETRRLFEMSIKCKNVPSLDELLEFIEERTRILDGLNKENDFAKPQKKLPMQMKNSHQSKSFFSKSKTQTCAICSKEKHPVYRCIKFKQQSVAKRMNIVTKNNLCRICLKCHPHSQCKSGGSCFVCGDKEHNSLLHPVEERLQGGHSSRSGDPPQTPGEREVDNKSSLISSALFSSGVKRGYVLVNTATVFVYDSQHKKRAVRAILDSVAQSSFISAECANALGLKKERITVHVSGLNDSATNIKSKVSARISNSNDECNFDVDLLLVPKITDLTPSKRLEISNINIPMNISLSDPTFFLPQKVDMLLGAQYFFQFLKPGKIELDDQRLVLQNSCFGYLVSGSAPLQHSQSDSSNVCFLSTYAENLDKTLKSFWEIENINEINPAISDELAFCNEHFETTHYRKPDGRYVVEMPFKSGVPEHFPFGESKKIASKRLDQTWKRLERDPVMKHLYTEFLEEYKNLHHMEAVNTGEISDAGYFLPHHGVLRPSSTTTKLRVVFDASAKTSNGKSLNDHLCKGGIIQDDLFSIMLRFRKHIYAFTADIEKMFRQIEIAPSQTKFQKILWKEGIDKPVQVYRLKTVTYGTACAPYLATRTLHQLATDERNNFPLASSVVMQDFYMDDCLSGASTLAEFNELKHQLTQLLLRGGMNLHKWCCNSSAQAASQTFPFDRNNEQTLVKTLGMLWNCSDDTFQFKVCLDKPQRTSMSSATKRDVLSQIARIFDPLGLLGPVLTKAKIIMQGLWLLKLDWHEKLPSSVSQEWASFIQSLPNIEKIMIPRCVLHARYEAVYLHGFADASERAFGAAIYLQLISNSTEISCHLLCSKSRVAPLKTLTVPRLELSACLLLSQLTSKVLTALKLKIDAVHLWSDSTIALGWINTSPHLLKTFVSNRVSQIQELTTNCEWGHVSSEDNPADLVSRGLDADALSSNELWWNGPNFLRQDYPRGSSRTYSDSSNEFTCEFKTVCDSTLAVSTDNSFLDNLLGITNNFTKLIRIVSFLFRFAYNVKNPDNKRLGPLTVQELQNATLSLVRIAQQSDFVEEVRNLQEGKPVSGKVRNLHPFLDKNGILRVGGRLQNASVRDSQKHPIILPPRHKLTYIILNYFHKKYLHLGPQNLLYCVRKEYWPLNGRNTCRKIVHQCVTCFKAKPEIAQQIMGELPKERVNAQFPFICTGVDLCGPFFVKYKGQRKAAPQKIYVCVFVCMVTKAIHLDFVSDLTSEAFIATLKRFFARRGKSSKIISDNATNFVGAKKELKRLYELAKSDADLINFLSSESIEWKFLPPRAPNFGGLWEAGVKSFKFHLKRTIGLQKLTLEEFLTILTQIEGILNSRPLTPLSEDIDDLEVLTPAHFLLGRPVTAITEPNLIQCSENRLDLWQKTTKMVQSIWKKWHYNYLSTLQQRSKWYIEKDNIKIGDMVVVKEDNLPCCEWHLGRIIDVFYGKDNKVRVVNVKTKNGIYKRAISKIAVLPLEK